MGLRNGSFLQVGLLLGFELPCEYGKNRVNGRELREAVASSCAAWPLGGHFGVLGRGIDDLAFSSELATASGLRWLRPTTVFPNISTAPTPLTEPFAGQQVHLILCVVITR